MGRYKIEVRELCSYDNTYHLIEEFVYNEFFSKSTIRDVKNYVINECTKLNIPLCKCFLEIKKFSEDKTYIEKCYDYSDDTYLSETIFNFRNLIKVCYDEKKCTCGKYETIKMQCEFLRKEKENEKKLEEREKQTKQYYEVMFQRQNQQQQREINRLQNLMDQQRNYNLRQFEMQNRNHQNEINRIQNERNIERQANNEKFNALTKTIEENKKQLEENETMKKNLLKAQKDAENDFINNNHLIITDYINNIKDIINEEVLKEMKNLKIDFNLTIEVIRDISKLEKFSKNVKDIIEYKVESLDEENIDFIVSHFNILILGNTGVGKSTLVNTILKKNMAQTDGLKPCTFGKPKAYESEEAKGIRIWDTRGIENGKYNLEAANEEILNTINDLIQNKDPDKFIHCIWYCISSNRFTDEERENLFKCYKSYIDNLPIIVIFTRADNPQKADKMLKHVQNEFEKKKNNYLFEDKKENDIKFIKLLAKKSKVLKKSYGIFNLMNETCESAKLGIERACIQSLLEQGQKLLKEEFQGIIDNFKEKKFKPLNRDYYSWENFISDNKLFSKEIVGKLLYNNDLSEKTKMIIDNLISNQSDNIKHSFENIFNNKLENLSNKLSENLIDFVANLDNKYNITYLGTKYNYNRIKKKGKEEIIKKLKPLLETKIYFEMRKILIEHFSQEFSEKLLELFQKLLEKNKKIREIFNEKGKLNADLCFKRIKAMINYPQDDLVMNNENEDDEDDD